MNTLTQLTKLNEVNTLNTSRTSTLKGGGADTAPGQGIAKFGSIANGKNGCPIGYDPIDPLKFMEKMERQGSM